MEECDERSKAKIKFLISSIEKENIEVIWPHILALNQCLNDKKIQTLIREIDTKKHEIRAVKDEHTETWQWIGVNARNFFTKE